MDQQYNYSPRDFVTVSARADTIESLAGQESEIRNVGPEPERATVTTGATTRGRIITNVQHGAAPTGTFGMTAPSSMDLTAAQSTAANRWDSVLNVSMLPSSTPVSDGHVWYFDTPPDTRLVEDVPTRPMKFREGSTLAPLASLWNVDSRSQIALEQPRVTFSAPEVNSKREDSVRLHAYHRTGIMSSVPSSIPLHREAQTPTQHTVSLVPNSALEHTPG